ncbi:MAG TPA: L-seryl-tRNA(Sec) selenium transferase [Solirubrobacteraceae bacterium]
MPDFRLIPSIDQLRQRAGVRALEAQFGAEATVDELRAAAAAVRRDIVGGRGGGEATGTEQDVASEIERRATDGLGRLFCASLEPVINASGVVIHTNLGRAPLAATAIERVAAVARGYSSLEYDLARGERGRRDVHAEALLCRLTGAEAASVVNNNAAATLIVLAALAAGREVIVSRGELVEIGGGFRVPDVMAQSGAILREVGTTNKTRASDYAAAVNERTALILRVHPSNFRMEGFTERPTAADLVAVGKTCNIPVAEDLGSGHVSDTTLARARVDSGTTLTPPWHRSEPAVQDSLTAGIDICCFSGDKLLGGPQAGVLVGKKEAIDRLKRHPLARAVRLDKASIAGLEATLHHYVRGEATRAVPVWRMIALGVGQIAARAEGWRGALAAAGVRAEVVASESAVGGGSLPGETLPTRALAVSPDGSAEALARRLRRADPPLVARIERDRVLIDPRTVLPEWDGAVRDHLLQFARS